MNLQEKIHTIADFYGMNVQICKFGEEGAELLYVLERQPVFGDKKPSANKAETNRFFLVFFKDE